MDEISANSDKDYKKSTQNMHIKFVYYSNIYARQDTTNRFKGYTLVD